MASRGTWPLVSSLVALIVRATRAVRADTSPGSTAHPAARRQTMGRLRRLSLAIAPRSTGFVPVPVSIDPVPVRIRRRSRSG